MTEKETNMKHPDSPLDIEIGFKKLFETYRTKLNSTNEVVKARAKEVLKVADQSPSGSD
jgi:hypothetical protein